MDHGAWPRRMPAVAGKVKTHGQSRCGNTGMRMDRVLIRLLSLIGLYACASIALPAQAQNAVEQFYRGKTVTILIGHPAGGSYDLYARLAAAHLGRFIPGNPQVLVQSRPGGSGAGAVQFRYAFGPRDGTLLGLFT